MSTYPLDAPHLDRAVVWGNPWHGLVKGGKLFLPATTKAKYPGEAMYFPASERPTQAGDGRYYTREGVEVALWIDPDSEFAKNRYQIPWISPFVRGSVHWIQGPGIAAPYQAPAALTDDAENGRDFRGDACLSDYYLLNAPLTPPNPPVMGEGANLIYWGPDGKRWLVRVAFAKVGGWNYELPYKVSSTYSVSPFGEFSAGNAAGSPGNPTFDWTGQIVRDHADNALTDHTLVGFFQGSPEIGSSSDDFVYYDVIFKQLDIKADGSAALVSVVAKQSRGVATPSQVPYFQNLVTPDSRSLLRMEAYRDEWLIYVLELHISQKPAGSYSPGECPIKVTLSTAFDADAVSTPHTLHSDFMQNVVPFGTKTVEGTDYPLRLIHYTGTQHISFSKMICACYDKTGAIKAARIEVDTTTALSAPPETPEWVAQATEPYMESIDLARTATCTTTVKITFGAQEIQFDCATSEAYAYTRAATGTSQLYDQQIESTIALDTATLGAVSTHRRNDELGSLSDWYSLIGPAPTGISGDLIIRPSFFGCAHVMAMTFEAPGDGPYFPHARMSDAVYGITAYSRPFVGDLAGATSVGATDVREAIRIVPLVIANKALLIAYTDETREGVSPRENSQILIAAMSYAGINYNPDQSKHTVGGAGHTTYWQWDPNVVTQTPYLTFDPYTETLHWLHDAPVTFV